MRKSKNAGHLPLGGGGGLRRGGGGGALLRGGGGGGCTLAGGGGGPPRLAGGGGGGGPPRLAGGPRRSGAEPVLLMKIRINITIIVLNYFLLFCKVITHYEKAFFKIYLRDVYLILKL